MPLTPGDRRYSDLTNTTKCLFGIEPDTASGAPDPADLEVGDEYVDINGVRYVKRADGNVYELLDRKGLVFGRGYTYFEGETRDTTSSILFQDKLLWTIASPGTYRIGWNTICGTDENTRIDVRIRDLTNDVNLGEFICVRDSDQQFPYGGFRRVVLAGSTDYALQFRATNTNRDVYLEQSRIEIYEVP